MIHMFRIEKTTIGKVVSYTIWNIIHQSHSCSPGGKGNGIQ